MAEDGKPKARQYDQVAVNSIWREHCKKELSILKQLSPPIGNPHVEKKFKKTTKKQKNRPVQKKLHKPLTVHRQLPFWNGFPTL
jgi:hypothetical protein